MDSKVFRFAASLISKCCNFDPYHIILTRHLCLIPVNNASQSNEVFISLLWLQVIQRSGCPESCSSRGRHGQQSCGEDTLKGVIIHTM